MSDSNNAEEVASAMDDFNDDTEEDNEIGAQITMAVDHIINNENFDSGEPPSSSVGIGEPSTNDVSSDAFETEDHSRNQWPNNPRANIEPHLSDHTYERSRPILTEADYDRMESDTASMLERQQRHELSNQISRWRSMGGSGPVRRSPRLRTRGPLSELIGPVENNRRIHGYSPYQNHAFSYRRRSTNNNIGVIDLTGSPVDRPNTSSRNSPSGQDSSSSGNDVQFATWSGTTGAFNPISARLELTPMVQFSSQNWNNPPPAVPLRSGSSCGGNARANSFRFGGTSSCSSATLYANNASRDPMSVASILALPSSAITARYRQSGRTLQNIQNIPAAEQYNSLVRLTRDPVEGNNRRGPSGGGGVEIGEGQQQEDGGERMEEEEEGGNSSNASVGARAPSLPLATQGGADDDDDQRRNASAFNNISSIFNMLGPNNARSTAGAPVSDAHLTNLMTRLSSTSTSSGNVINSGRLSNLHGGAPSRPLHSSHTNSIYDRMMDDSLPARPGDVPPVTSNQQAVPSLIRQGAVSFARINLINAESMPSDQNPPPYNLARQTTSSTPRLSTNPLNFLTHTSLDTMPRSFEDLSRELVQLLECPICFDYAVPPISQCMQGHIACGTCRPKLTSCPSCRTIYQEARNLLMEKVASMVRFPCKNSGTGCTEQVYLFEKEKHEQGCGYRQYACLVFQCHWKGYKPEVLVHMQSAHSTQVVRGENTQLQVPINGEKSAWLMCAFEELFHISFFSANHSLFGCVQYIGPCEEAKRFNYKFVMMSEEGGIPRNYCYTRLTHAFDQQPEESMLSYDLFNIGHRALNHFRCGAKVNIQVTLSGKSNDKLLPPAAVEPSADATVESEETQGTSST